LLAIFLIYIRGSFKNANQGYLRNSSDQTKQQATFLNWKLECSLQIKRIIENICYRVTILNKIPPCNENYFLLFKLIVGFPHSLTNGLPLQYWSFCIDAIDKLVEQCI
jgi:hypothetical protein